MNDRILSKNNSIPNATNLGQVLQEKELQLWEKLASERVHPWESLYERPPWSILCIMERGHQGDCEYVSGSTPAGQILGQFPLSALAQKSINSCSCPRFPAFRAFIHTILSWRPCLLSKRMEKLPDHLGAPAQSVQ